MRALLWVVLLAFAGWSGWWWLASDNAQRGALGWFEGLRAQGMRAGHAGVAVQGYPNRVDLTVTAPEFLDPTSGWGWQAPFVQVFAMTWKPWHLIAAFAPEQRLLTPLGPLDLTAEKLQSSLVLVPGPDLALSRFQLAGEGLGWGGLLEGRAEQLSLATRASVGQPLAHDLGLDLRGVHPGDAVLALLPAGLVPERLELLRLDAELTLSAPLDRHIGAAPPGLTGLRLRNFRLDWGDISLTATGELKPDAAGYAEGRIDLRASGWREALALGGALGLIAPDAVPAWQKALSAEAQADGALTLPLSFGRGRVGLGPLTLGPAPYLGRY